MASVEPDTWDAGERLGVIRASVEAIRERTAEAQSVRAEYRPRFPTIQNSTNDGVHLDVHTDIPFHFVRALLPGRYGHARSALAAAINRIGRHGLWLSREVLSALSESTHDNAFAVVLQNYLASEATLTNASYLGRDTRAFNVLRDIPGAYDRESYCGLWLSPQVLRQFRVASSDDDDAFAAVFQHYLDELRFADTRAYSDYFESISAYDSEGGAIGRRARAPAYLTFRSFLEQNNLTDPSVTAHNDFTDPSFAGITSDAPDPVQMAIQRSSLRQQQSLPAAAVQRRQLEAGRIETFRRTVNREYIYVAEFTDVESITRMDEETGLSRDLVRHSPPVWPDRQQESEVVAHAYTRTGNCVILFNFR